jgi:hypothetical protein
MGPLWEIWLVTAELPAEIPAKISAETPAEISADLAALIVMAGLAGEERVAGLISLLIAAVLPAFV